jgi:hypothetical protein
MAAIVPADDTVGPARPFSASAKLLGFVVLLMAVITGLPVAAALAVYTLAR